MGPRKRYFKEGKPGEANLPLNKSIIPKRNKANSIKPGWQYILLIAVLGFLLYSNTLHNPFMYDDKIIIAENSSIKSLYNIPKLFVSEYWAGSTVEGEGQNLWRPLVMASYTLDYFIYKLNPAGFHLTNIVFHILNSLLVFYLAMIILAKANPETAFSNRVTALFVALIFSVHTVHTEAVTGIVGRAELMATFFYLLALLAYIMYRGRLKYYLLSIMAFGLALLSKETALTLPGMIILYDIVFSGKPENIIGERYRAYLGYAGGLALYIVSKFIVFGTLLPAGNVSVFYNESIFTRLFTMSRVFTRYIVLFFSPVNLSVAYNKHDFLSYSLNIESLVFIGFVLLVTVFAKRIYRYSKILCFAIGWFFVTMIPMSNIIPIGELIAERFLYLPSVAFCLFAGVFISWIKREKTGFTVLAAMLILFSFLTVKRNHEWRDGITFWTSALRTNPDSASALINRGRAYMDSEFYDEAIADLDKAILLDGLNARAYNNRGFSFWKKGLDTKALADFGKAIELYPKDKKFFYNRGNVYAGQERLRKALADYNEAISLDPEDVRPYINRGSVYARLALNGKAKADFTKAIELNPAYSEEPYYNRGITFFNEGLYNEAIADFTMVLSMLSSDTEAYIYRSIAYERMGRKAEAAADFNKAMLIDKEKAVSLNAAKRAGSPVPNANASGTAGREKKYNMQGIRYCREGLLDRAIIEFDRAIELNPNNPKSYNNRGIAFDMKGLHGRAIKDFSMAIKLDSEYVNAYENRAIAYRKINEPGLARKDEEKAGSL